MALQPVIGAAAESLVTGAAEKALDALIAHAEDFFAPPTTGIEFINLTGDELILRDWCFPFYGSDHGQGTGPLALAKLPSQSGTNNPGFELSSDFVKAPQSAKTSLVGGGFDDFAVAAPAGAMGSVGMLYYTEHTLDIASSRYGFVLGFYGIRQKPPKANAFLSLKPSKEIGTIGKIDWDSIWKNKITPKLRAQRIEQPWKLKKPDGTENDYVLSTFCAKDEVIITLREYK